MVYGHPARSGISRTGTQFPLPCFQVFTVSPWPSLIPPCLSFPTCKRRKSSLPTSQGCHEDSKKCP